MKFIGETVLVLVTAFAFTVLTSQAQTAINHHSELSAQWHIAKWAIMLASVVFIASVTLLYWFFKRKETSTSSKLDIVSDKLDTVLVKLDTLSDKLDGISGKLDILIEEMRQDRRERNAPKDNNRKDSL